MYSWKIQWKEHYLSPNEKFTGGVDSSDYLTSERGEDINDFNLRLVFMGYVG